MLYSKLTRKVKPQVLGCHLRPTSLTEDYWKYWYPSPDGTKCICSHDYGAECIATCASNIVNYEIVSVYGTGTVTASCAIPNNQVLGCGNDRIGESGLCQFRSVYSQTNSCQCIDNYGTRCYAICGDIW